MKLILRTPLRRIYASCASPSSRHATRSRPSRNLQNHSELQAQPQKDLSPNRGDKIPSLADALKATKAEDNNLLSPVHVPENPNDVLNERHPAASLLANSGIVVQRQLELMNIMIGFEQANKYVILDPQGNHIGFMAEQDTSMGKTMARQMFSTHRSFTTHVFDKHEKEVLRFHRPFSWIFSRIGVYDPIEAVTSSYTSSKGMTTSIPGSLTSQLNDSPTQLSNLSLSDMRIIGEAQQQWAPLRRKYNLFLHHQSSNSEENPGTRQIASGPMSPSSPQQLQLTKQATEVSVDEYSQFAYVDEPFLSWDFSLRSNDGNVIGSVSRNWGGIGREFFTDTGVYALRMDAAEISHDPRTSTGQGREAVINKSQTPGMTLDQRAVMLATAVSIDFDYFSRHSGASGGAAWMPLWFPTGGGGAAAGGEAVAAGEAAEGSVISGSESQGLSGVGKERAGAAVGAGSLAGYEAMQREGIGLEEENQNRESYPDPFPDVPIPTGNRQGGSESVGSSEGGVDGGGFFEDAADAAGDAAGSAGDAFSDFF
ncbi:MAG: hypothetical protein Q9220_004102 [cf. Caloplaca sp. 1 TL-2023]